MGLIDNIKSAAAGNKTKIQTSDANDLEKIFNRMFYLPKNVKEETKFVRQVMTRGLESQERKGLHASALIVDEKKFCLRAQVLSLIYKQLQGEQINVGLMKIFEEGNAVHEKWQRLLIRAGYSTADDLDVTQYNEEYMISFTPDILCDIPEFHDERMVGELKSMNTYQFKDMMAKGKNHPSAGKQLQWYMFLKGYRKGFVLTEDKNSQDIKIEIHDYDSKVVAPFIDRAEQIKYYYNRVFKCGKMVKRPDDATSPSCKRCATCAMRDACWNIGMGKVRL